MNFSDSPRAGDLFFDSSPAPPKLDLSGARSHFYRSPQTPSAASSLCRSITPNQANQGSRKRARYGYDDFDNYNSISNNVASCFDGRSGGWDDQWSTSLSGRASPSPLVNTRYKLAGGIESPCAQSGLSSLSACDELNNSGNGPEVDYRMSRYQVHGQPTGTDTNSKKRGRRPSTSSSDTVTAEKDRMDNGSEKNWGRAVINLVGNVAGKVWDFCWSGSFRGFYAGGGQGYDLNATPSGPSADYRNSQGDCNSEGIWEKNTEDVHGIRTRNGGPDELRNNWVLVKGEDQDFAQSVRKAPRRTSVAPHIAPRRTPARPIVSKRANFTTPARPSAYRHQHPSSLASPKPNSPSSVETQRFTAKMRKQDREEDASIRRLNQQLKSMIREGKEALGTRVEIDEMDFGDAD